MTITAQTPITSAADFHKQGYTGRHAKPNTIESIDREIVRGASENFNWLPGFGKHRAPAQKGTAK